jgi:thiol-disulfide isomerase/thioredoxin
MGKKKSSVLKVDMESKIPALEKILKNGKVTIVLVFADWCGHCQTFKKDIWNPMCQKEAVHNRVSVRDDMIGKTSLKKANFEYLPSVMVVNEKGELENFPSPQDANRSPEGKFTNVIPTPKTLEEMTRIVNVPLKQASATGMSQNKNMNMENENMNINGMKTQKGFYNENESMNYENENMDPKNMNPKNMDLKNMNPKNMDPERMKYENENMQSKSMRGGALLQTLSEVGQGVIPAGVLGSLALMLKGGKRSVRSGQKTRKQKRSKRHTRKHK